MSSEKRKIVSIVTAVTGHQVVIGESELDHALQKHFRIPKIKLLEIIEQILKDPSFVLLEESKSAQIKEYHLFYKLDDGGHLVVIVKVKDSESLFSSVYPTGKSIRNPHKKLKKVKI
jgi:hypothetical protein